MLHYLILSFSLANYLSNLMNIIKDETPKTSMYKGTDHKPYPIEARCSAREFICKDMAF